MQERAYSTYCSLKYLSGQGDGRIAKLKKEIKEEKNQYKRNKLKSKLSKLRKELKALQKTFVVYYRK